MAQVLVSHDGGVARVSMNRPDARNAMTIEMLDELVKALDALAVDESLQVVVVTGEGADFSVGADLAAMGGGDPSRDRSEGLADPRIWDSYRIPVVLHDMPQVTIGAIDGACAGAGFAIACGCDLRICSDRSVLRTAFARVGVAGDMSGAWTLQRLVGPAKALELFLLNPRIAPEEALALGLVNQVVAAEDFEATVREVARSIAALAPLSLRGMKANAHAAEHLPIDEYSLIESRRHMDLLATQDVVEAAIAFLEKRPPVFRGH